MKKINYRVGAISHADEITVYLFGYGIYKGDFPCPEINNVINPCIELDNNKIIWGKDCWWGPEETVKEFIGSREVVIVDEAKVYGYRSFGKQLSLFYFKKRKNE